MVDWFSDKALGWLGWPPSEALAADLNAIVIAYNGDIARRNILSGAGRKGRSAPFDLRAFRLAHNAARAARNSSE